MIYAIKEKDRFDFGCLSKSREELEDKIVKAYQAWKVAQREEHKSMSIFMERYKRVKITVEEIE
jgi:hypothetical protein|tara:strand:+ start:294 stop:485 length:192 start_codon:yes stop_codon:yes gene_type:complete